jgi:endonuclease I
LIHFPHPRRNDRIHAQWKGNRNPFIDHPEWASAIWS